MAGHAHADSNADGGTAHSPGLLSGNTVQLPVNVPVNVCGNTVNVIGLLNPAVGNSCTNASQGGGSHGGQHKPGHHSSGGATAEGGAKGSPGVLSGNAVQLPVDVPVNVTGNSVNVVGIGNPAVGNSSTNTSGKPPVRPKPPVTPPKAVPPQKQAPQQEAPRHTQALARTGAGPIGFAAPAGAALLLGGLVLYRRARPARES